MALTTFISAGGATLPAFRELWLHPFATDITVPVRPIRRRRIGPSVNDAHGRFAVLRVLDPEVGAGLIHRDPAGRTLEMHPREATGNTRLFQQIRPMLAKHEIRRACQSNHESQHTL